MCFSSFIDIVTSKPESDKITGEWRGLHNAEPYDLYCSQSTIRAIKPRRMRWVGLVARVVDRRGAYRVWLVDLREINLFEHLRIDRRVILGLIFKKRDGSTEWIDLAQDRDRWWALVSAVMNLCVP